MKEKAMWCPWPGAYTSKATCTETGTFQDTWPEKNVFYIEKGGEPEVKSSFCHVVSQLARDVSQSGPASWGYGSGTAQC